MTPGFRWCQHCGRPHHLDERLCPTTGHSLDEGVQRALAAAAPSPILGTLLDGKYRILRLIGKGGMGQVFEAEDLQLKRMVAIKVVGARAAGPEAVQRLEREAHVIAAIPHTNICAVHGLGRMADGAPYVVFERLFGQTLAARIRGGRRLSLNATIELFAQILSGLGAAHAKRIIHRDLKPENVVLVDRPGSEPLVKIVDFGFARDLSATDSRITRPGRLCGTAQYMSPEQLRAEPLDPRSDLFSLGIMMYEALAGRHPFEATSLLDLQINILGGTFAALRSRRPDVPPTLAALVAAALSAAPSSRPATAMGMRTELLAVARELTVAALGDDEPASVTDPVWLPPPSSPAP